MTCTHDRRPADPIVNLLACRDMPDLGADLGEDQGGQRMIGMH